MVAQFVSSLERPISKTRLLAYRPAGSSELDMIVNYLFNIELSESLYPSLQAFEVALRNSVHATIGSHFGDDLWFDRPDLLAPWQIRKVAEARRKLTENGKPHEAGRVVAEMNFGFWHSMFNRPYENKLWLRNGNPALIVDAFPNIPRRLRTRRTIWDRCDVIRDVRNRVFHYEPVWNDPNLGAKHAQTLDALGWISQEMMAPIALCDRFTTVHRYGRELVEQKVKAYLGLL